jgi:hypothetical protein
MFPPAIYLPYNMSMLIFVCSHCFQTAMFLTIIQCPPMPIMCADLFTPCCPLFQFPFPRVLIKIVQSTHLTSVFSIKFKQLSYSPQFFATFAVLEGIVVCNPAAIIVFLFAHLVAQLLFYILGITFHTYCLYCCCYCSFCFQYVFIIGVLDYSII